MMHSRAQIRTKVHEMLAGTPENRPTSAAERVYRSRAIPVGKGRLPCILVYSDAETAHDQQSAPREYRRELDLVIEIAAAATDELDDVLDGLAEEVERVMEADRWLGDLAADTELTESRLRLVKDGDKLYGSAVLTYRVTYFAWSPAFVDLPDMGQAYIDWDVAPADGRIEARDQITLETE